MTGFDALRQSLDPAYSYLLFRCSSGDAAKGQLAALCGMLEKLKVNVLAGETCRDENTGGAYLVVKLQCTALPGAVHEMLFSQLPGGLSYLLFMAKANRQ